MRSLLARIVLTTMVLLIVVCAVVGVGAALSLRHFQTQQLDDDVTRTLQFSARPPQDGAGPPPPDAGGGSGGGSPTDRIEVRIVDGRVVSAVALGFRGNDSDLPAAAVTPFLAVTPDDVPDDGPRDVQTVELPALGETYRVAARTAGDGTVIAIGGSTDRVDATVARLALTETIIFGGGVLVAGVIAAFATRATLRPLHRVSATARRVSELPLERGEVELDDRVPAADADPRTEVGQVGAAFNRMLEHVARSLAARQESETRVRQFVADASHELRTPLAAIRGYSELARRRIGASAATGEGQEELPAEVGAMLERVGSQTERMTLLVEDLLLLARLDAGRPLAREPVDLARVVLDAVSDAHAASPEHQWALELPDDEGAEDAGAEDVLVIGDPERLHQVVANLLANARTHTPAGTNVVVELARDDGRVRLVVRDDGPGIAADLLPHVLERFARGDVGRARTSSSTSTGLGLSIVAAVVTEHGGTVEVTSVPGDTRTTVVLPAAPVRAELALR